MEKITIKGNTFYAEQQCGLRTIGLLARGGGLRKPTITRFKIYQTKDGKRFAIAINGNNLSQIDAVGYRELPPLGHEFWDQDFIYDDVGYYRSIAKFFGIKVGNDEEEEDEDEDEDENRLVRF